MSTRPANDLAELKSPGFFTDRLAQAIAVIGIVDAVGGGRAQVEHFMSQLAQMVGELGLHVEGCMIGNDGDPLGHVQGLRFWLEAHLLGDGAGICHQ